MNIGIFFCDYWKRHQSKLAHDWHTEYFEKMEIDRVEYSKKLQRYRLKKGDMHAYFPEYVVYIKYFVSFLIILFMVILFYQKSFSKKL
jgi:hypothetical protein